MSIPKCNFPGISKASYTEKVREVNATVSIPWLAKNITCISLLMCMHVNGKHYNIFQSRFKKKKPLLFGIYDIINNSLTKLLKSFVFFEGGREGVKLSCMRQTDILTFSKTISELFIHIVVTYFFCYLQWICIFYNILWSSFTNWKHRLYKLPNYQLNRSRLIML